MLSNFFSFPIDYVTNYLNDDAYICYIINPNSVLIQMPYETFF